MRRKLKYLVEVKETTMWDGKPGLYCRAIDFGQVYGDGHTWEEVCSMFQKCFDVMVNWLREDGKDEQIVLPMYTFDNVPEKYRDCWIKEIEVDFTEI